MAHQEQEEISKIEKAMVNRGGEEEEDDLTAQIINYKNHCNDTEEQDISLQLLAAEWE